MPEAPTVPAATPVDRAKIPLLTLITQQALDEDYRVVADRRASAAPPGESTGRPHRERAQRGSTRPRPHWTAAVVVAVFGLMVAIAAVQTSAGQDVRSASRTTLVAQISAGQDRLADLQRRIVRLREAVVAQQTRLDRVTSDQQAAATRLQRAGAATGFGAVSGPGVRVTVDDAADGTLVRDRDLRLVVNGLWRAGAEAIAVNGQRLTARSAIRNSGDAIRVNNRSLSPPYVVTAIGDEQTLQADLMETTTGLEFRDTAETFGFPWSMENVDQQTLPAAPARVARLRFAVKGTAEQNQHDQQREKGVPQ